MMVIVFPKIVLVILLGKIVAFVFIGLMRIILIVNGCGIFLVALQMTNAEHNFFFLGKEYHAD